ncbi:MAG: hypothetical protein IAF38_06020 [Bacteroidia bacterium]|nr:hypothetical protein [Bacteroidia bacterium]
MVGNFFGFCLMLLVASQDLFFGQASMVLPEVFLALGVIWSFYFFAKDKTVHYIIFSSLLVLVKEQGALLIFSFCLWRVLEKISGAGLKSLFTKEFILKLFYTASPVLILFLFLGIQKLQRGYVFFPSHIDMIKMEWSYMVWNFRLIMDILFLQTGKETWAYLFLIVFLFFSKKILFWRRLLVVFFLYTTLKLSFNEWDKPLWFSLPFGIIAICFIIYQLQLTRSVYPKQGRVADPRGSILVFIIVFCVFASFNFFCNRYLLCLFPLVLFYFLYEIFKAFEKEKAVLFILIPAMIFFSAFKTLKNETVSDCSAYYTDGVKIQMELIKFAGDHEFWNKKILVSFVMVSNMTDPAVGFLNGKGYFPNVGCEVDTTNIPEVILFTNFDGSAGINNMLATGKYEPVQYYKHGLAEGTVFILKNPVSR